MNNNPMIMNGFKRIFDSDSWNGKVKIVMKPIEFKTEELTGPLYSSKFLNFSYIDVAYKHLFLGENFLKDGHSHIPPNTYWWTTTSYSRSADWSSYLEYADPYLSSTTGYINYSGSPFVSCSKQENETLDLIESEFNKLCKTIIDKDFELRRTNPNDNLFNLIESEGDGCISLFYIFMNLLLNTCQNLVINNVELSLHYFSLEKLKQYIEENFNFKVIFLAIRADLFDQKSGIENLYVLGDNQIKEIMSFDFMKNKDKNKIKCLDLRKLLYEGRFGNSWKIKDADEN